MTPPRLLAATRSRLSFAGLVFGLLATALFAAAPDKKDFDIPAGTAERSLRLFSTQSGAELVYPAEIVRGVPTPEVKGEMTAAQALGRLLTGSNLVVTHDEKNAAFTISRADPN